MSRTTGWIIVGLLAVLVAFAWWETSKPSESDLQGALSNCFVARVAEGYGNEGITVCNDEYDRIGDRAFAAKYAHRPR